MQLYVIQLDRHLKGNITDPWKSCFKGFLISIFYYFLGTFSGVDISINIKQLPGFAFRDHLKCYLCPLNIRGWEFRQTQLRQVSEWSFQEIFYLTVAPPFPGSHLNMFLVKKGKPPLFYPRPGPAGSHIPTSCVTRPGFIAQTGQRSVCAASCGEMAIA